MTLPPVATLPAVEASASASSLAPVILVATMPTPIGPLTVLAADGIVRAGGFTEDVGALAVRLGPEHTGASLEMVDDLGTITEALAAYFAGDVRALDTIPVSQHGGPFQQRVWAALRTLPPGQLVTYRDLGVQLGGPQFARAVGAGCASNLISPIVPCHRVTRTDGALAGYFWGLERKRWLLDHERRHGDHTRRPA
jgi:methylated-DNA-[protein]-cysteine S-methyltransferase